MRADSPILPRVILISLVAILLGTFALINHLSVRALNELQQQSVEATAKVSSKWCENHGYLYYSYSVEGKQFVGGGYCNQGCMSLAVNDPIKITYARNNPGHSECERIDGLLYKNNSNYILLALIFVGLSVVVIKMTSVKSD